MIHKLADVQRGGRRLKLPFNMKGVDVSVLASTHEALARKVR